MILKLLASDNSVYVVLAEDIRAIEFPSPEQLKQLSAPLLPDPKSPIIVHMQYGSCFGAMYGQAQEIENLISGFGVQWHQMVQQPGQVISNFGVVTPLQDHPEFPGHS